MLPANYKLIVSLMDLYPGVLLFVKKAHSCIVGFSLETMSIA